MESASQHLRTLTLVLSVALLLAGPLAAPLHAHDPDSAQSCRLCQTERTDQAADAGLRSSLPTLIDLGTPSADEPVLEAIDATESVRGRAPPASVRA